MRRIVLAVVLASAGLVVMPKVHAEMCICRFEKDEINVKNFPEVQTVAIARSLVPIEVKETDLLRTFSAAMDIGTSEKKPIGPLPLDGRRKILIQVSQVFPKVGTPPPVVLKWYVRFHQEDPFFDPCLMDKDKEGKEPHACTTGFPPVGARLRPLMPPSLADQLEEFYISYSPTGIATLDPVGTEGLLVVENTGSGPRALRVNVVLER